MAFTAALLLHGVAIGLVLSPVKRSPLPLFASSVISVEVMMTGAAQDEVSGMLAEALPPVPESRALPASASLPEVAPLMMPDPAVPGPTPWDSAESAVRRVDPLSLVSPARGGFLPERPATGAGKAAMGSPASAAPAAGTPGVRGPSAVLSEVQLRYPYYARAEGQEGAVTVRVQVSAEGRVQSAEVVRSSGFAALDEAAVGAVTKARFAPAERGGQRVTGQADVTFDFRLKD
jgi:protein TonB